MMSIGWKGKDVSTFTRDVLEADLTVPFDAEIAEYNNSRWTSARLGGAAPLSPARGDVVTEMNKAFADDDSSIPF